MYGRNLFFAYNLNSTINFASKKLTHFNMFLFKIDDRADKMGRDTFNS